MRGTLETVLLGWPLLSQLNLTRSPSFVRPRLLRSVKGICEIKNFGDYKIGRMSDAPQIIVNIIDKGPKATDRHHREGAPFEILIRLKLPAGREVDVSQTPGEDERYANFNFAMSDAFRRAERQLRDAVKRMQGEVKSSSEQPIGTVRRSRSGTRVPIARRDQQPCPSSKAGARQ